MSTVSFAGGTVSGTLQVTSVLRRRGSGRPGRPLRHRAAELRRIDVTPPRTLDGVTAPARTQDRRIALHGAARAELLVRCERAVQRARRTGRSVLAGLTVRVDPDVDPSAVVFASRRATDDWFCFEQPDRDGAALATLGSVTRLADRSEARFDVVAAAWRRLAGDAVADLPDGPPGAGSSPSAASRSPPPARPRRTGRASGRAAWSCPRSRSRGAGATCG